MTRDASLPPAARVPNRDRGPAGHAAPPATDSLGAPAGADDAALAARLIAGDRAALADCYDQYGAAVYGISRHLLGDERQASDVCEAVFVQLWTRPDLYRPALGGLRAQLCWHAHRESVRRLRSRGARSVPAPTSGPRAARAAASRAAGAAGAAASAGPDRRAPAPSLRAPGLPAAPPPNLDEAVQSWLRAGKAQAALQQLPAHQRQALELAYFAGRSCSEIACSLGATETEAKAHLRGGLVALARALGPAGPGREQPRRAPGPHRSHTGPHGTGHEPTERPLL